MQYNPNRSALPGKPPGVLTRVVAVIAAVALTAIALMFSVVVFAIAIAVGAVVWAWLWWRMRQLRKQMEKDPRFQEMRRRSEAADSEVIEGIVIREVHESRDERRD
jgi:membrane protein implicated in regulation of membrane protease activity